MPTSKYTPDAPSATAPLDLPPDQSDHEKHHLWIWLLALAAVLIIGGALYWHHRAAAEAAAAAARNQKPPGITITVATAQKGNIGVYLDAIGTVTPVYTDSITSQVNGLVESVSFKEGQVAHKGDPLIDIDSRPYRATLLQAQGTLQRDENLLAEANLDLQRYKAALARKAIAEQIEADQELLHADAAVDDVDHHVAAAELAVLVFELFGRGHFGLEAVAAEVLG